MSNEPEARVQQLENAFELFNQMSSQLEASYRGLENRVAQLNQELAAARSERLRQLAEKERLANRLERLLELLPGGVVVVDAEGRVAECNTDAEQLLGQPLQGAYWQDVAHRSFAPDSGDGSDVTLRSGRRVNVSMRSLSPEPGRIVLLMDVTEQHALHDQLNHYRRLSAMGEMAASLAHQVRTPLASSLLYVSHLGRTDLGEAERTRFSAKALDRLRHLERMVNDMLQFARGGSFEAAEFPACLLAEDLVAAVQPELESGDGSIEVDDQTEGALIRGSREALHSALLNLATNSIQASGQGAWLRLELQSDEDAGAIVVRLHDRGPGVPDEARERLFEPFFTTRPDGTGLGLPVVQAIASAHQGEVCLERSDADGSTFTLRLPRVGDGPALPSGRHEEKAVQPTSPPLADDRWLQRRVQI